MASTSAFGIACAGLTAALAASSNVASQAGQSTSHTLIVEIAGLRNAKGVLRLCLAGKGGPFPDCGANARNASVKAQSGTVRYTFSGLPEGDYAVAAFHDANGNGKLDTMLGVPREGFAFSNNPPLRPRAPNFAESRIFLSRDAKTQLKMRYIF